MSTYSQELLEIKKVRMALSSLSVYRNILEDKIISKLNSLLTYIDNKQFDIYQASELYNVLFFTLIDSAPQESLKDYLVRAIVLDENPYSKTSETQDLSYINQIFRRPVENDLNSLQIISNLRSSVVRNYLSNYTSLNDEVFLLELPSWDFDNNSNLNETCKTFEPLKSIFYSCDKWSECFTELTGFYSRYGYGMFALYKSFVWEHSGHSGFLRCIENPDPITLSDLIDYKAERSEVINNTKQLLNGFSANNILLYGDRGTGKSSTVKAILNEYYNLGLRIIEVPKMHLIDFTEIVRSLRNRRHKFIVFVDDLVFEDNEENYTSLKAVLEGGIESKPQNVVIYATSNRRHLIKEKFSDRQGLLSSNHDDEVRAADSIQEKLSLADRFGITIVFSSPDKEKYLNIVEGIAAKRGISLNKETLHKEAMKWELWYNGRSPRTARQFVDWLEGQKLTK